MLLRLLSPEKFSQNNRPSLGQQCTSVVSMRRSTTAAQLQPGDRVGQSVNQPKIAGTSPK